MFNSDMEQVQLRQRLPELAIISIFLLAVTTPLLGWLLGKDLFYSEAEKRELISFPEIGQYQSITGFSRAFDDYYQDHFGMREWFIHRYQREVDKRFGATGFADVVEGGDGWFFYAGDGLLEDLRGELHFSDKQRQLFWNRMEEREEWLGARGVAYIFLVAPDKQSIYPEYLPLSLRQTMGESRLDQLLAAKPQGKSQTLLDIRSRLQREKGEHVLYDRSDTHWNLRGSSYAYRAIVERTQTLFPAFISRPDFHFAPRLSYLPGGDLAQMIGRSKEIAEGRPVLMTTAFSGVEKPLPEEIADLVTLPALQAQYSENQRGQLRVLVLHDSFFNQLRPFVSETYASVLYLWKYADRKTLGFFTEKRMTDLIEIYEPDLVIEETVERRLPRFLFPYVEE
ncbi:MAG: hypothetical protein ABFR63_10685 [Thermodesulfobacteriota bacterium]